MTEREEERLYEHLGRCIRQFRRENPSLSQSELGEEVGLSRSSIVNIEKGRQHPPLHVIWEIADVLDVEVSTLLPSKQEVATSSAEVDPELLRKIQEELGDDDDDTLRRIAEFVQDSSS